MREFANLSQFIKVRPELHEASPQLNCIYPHLRASNLRRCIDDNYLPWWTKIGAHLRLFVAGRKSLHEAISELHIVAHARSLSKILFVLKPQNDLTRNPLGVIFYWTFHWTFFACIENNKFSAFDQSPRTTKFRIVLGSIKRRQSSHRRQTHEKASPWFA